MSAVVVDAAERSPHDLPVKLYMPHISMKKVAFGVSKGYFRVLLVAHIVFSSCFW